MKSKKTLFFCVAGAMVIAACVLFFALWPKGNTAPADETKNLLANAGFESIDGDGMPSDWAEDMWLWDFGMSYLSMSDDAYTGAKSILVENADENDARFSQTVEVSPNAYYRISCMVKAEHIDEGADGAGISIQDTFSSSDYVYDTNGEWVRLTLYGQTGADQTEMTVMARVGGYGSLNRGRAWFDDIEMVRLNELPEGVTSLSFATHEPTGGASEDASGEAGATQTPLIATVMILFLIVGCAAVLWERRRRPQPKMPDKGDGQSALWMSVILGAALIVRIILAVSIRGYEADMNCFESWAGTMGQMGSAGFYTTTSFCDYPPVYMLVLWMLEGFRNLFALPGDGPVTWLLIKSVPIVLDLALAYYLYRLARSRIGERGALLLSAFYALNPAVLVNSAAWGQVDSVLTLLLIIAILEAVKGRWQYALPVYVLAVLTKPQGLMFGPIALLVLILGIVRSQDRKRALMWMGVGLGAALVLAAAVILPFTPGKTNPVAWIAGLYRETLSSYPMITLNACNIYQVLNLNWVPLESMPVVAVCGTLAYVLAFGCSFTMYILAKDRKKAFLACAVMLGIIFAFGVKMHERYLFPVIALLAVAYAMDRDVRLLLIGVVLSAGQFANTSLVLQSTHLVSSQQAMNTAVSVINVLGILALIWVGFDICIRRHVVEDVSLPFLKDSGIRTWNPVREDARLHMKRLDYVLMLGLTLVYSAVAFVNLGVPAAPETAWVSTASGETVTFDLGETRTFHMTYYGGICNSTFEVSMSEDGEAWSEPYVAVYDQGEIFRWLWYVPSAYEDGEFVSMSEETHPMQTARYVRLTAQKVGLTLHEVAFIDGEGETYPIASVSSSGGEAARAQDAAALIDEQDTVPAYPSYYNGTYFDEIYHARTAYEHLHGMRPYETTHPPLGKVLIMLGVALFGMNPFGWRFAGTLVGVLMIPVMYLLVKQLIKRTDMAFLGAFLIAADCMHFTQTRIATIDSYGVFFIMLMYLFMFRYCQMSFHHDKLWKTMIPLALSGLFMGLGIASKWIGVYAAVGLAVLLFFTLGRRYLEYRAAIRDGRMDKAPFLDKFRKNLVITLACCVIFFIVIPLLIYYFSYYWYMKPLGGLNVSSVVQAQIDMLEYHAGLGGDPHWFRSYWYEWPVIAKPMWYYSGNNFMQDGYISSISCMGNPAVWWGGLLALIFVIVQLIRGKGNRTYLYLVIGFLAQYLPWVLVPRSTFIYHYFASVPFIILCTVMAFDELRARNFKYYRTVLYAFMGVALLLFIGFYPLMSGTPIPRDYAAWLRWFKWHNY